MDVLNSRYVGLKLQKKEEPFRAVWLPPFGKQLNLYANIGTCQHGMVETAKIFCSLVCYKKHAAIEMENMSYDITPHCNA